MGVDPDKVKIDPNKVDSIGVDEVSREINHHDLLQPDIEKGKTPFFDGYIWVYEKPRQINDHYSGRIPIQVKGRSTDAFKKKKCTHRPITIADLNAYKKESGIIFFIVEILKENKEKTKIFWKQLLPYDLHKLSEKLNAKKTKSASIDLRPLEGHDLTLICQNFLKDRDRQRHGKIKTVFEINGIKKFDITAITGQSEKGDKAINDYILDKNPLYLYANDANDTSFPIANIVEDGLYLAIQDSADVWVANKCYGSFYFSRQMNENGYYYQFGQSCKFFLNGKMNFSLVGDLDERIRDIDFMLEFIKCEKIRVGEVDLPFSLKVTMEHETIKNNMLQTFELLKTIKQVFDFLGMKLPVDIASLNEDDFYRIAALAEHVVHGKECPVTFKKDGVNILGIGKYRFVVLVYQKNIVNWFSRQFNEIVRAVIEMNDGTQEKISPYFSLNSEIIAKSSNFDPDLVMESIKSFSYTEQAGVNYNNLLLEAIDAIDIDPTNRLVVRFANDLADYLLENEDGVIHRLNKMQIKKRSGLLDDSDNSWLLAERNEQNEPRILCGIAILLEDKTLFEEQFTKLSRKLQAEFKKYPIMKLFKSDIVLAKKKKRSK